MSVTSVQDLIAASKNNSQSPFISLMEGVAQGGAQGYQQAPDRQLKMMKIQQEQQAMQAQAEMRAQFAADQGTKSAYNALAPGVMATPQQKASSEWDQDSSGRLSRKLKAANPAQDMTKVTITPELAQKHPGLVVGSQVPATFLAENNAAQQARGDKQSEARITAMGKDLDPSQGRSGQFGISQQNVNRAERLKALASAIPDGNLDSRQIEELAVGLNAMLSGSNTGAQAQVAALVPHSVTGNAKKLQEWLTNEPQGTNQQEFVNRMLGSIEREQATSQDQINRVQFQRLSRYDDVRKGNSSGWENTVRSYGLDPAAYDSWKKGGYKTMNAGQGGAAPAASSDHAALLDKYGAP